MADHNHITRQVHPFGDCPACDVVWESVFVVPSYIVDFKTQFQVAETILVDYGKDAQYKFLEQLQTTAQDKKVVLQENNFLP